MKIIALLPFKNEEWILPTYLSSVRSKVDEIVALDDGSTDRGPMILAEAGARVVSLPSPATRPIPMSERRQLLLEEGRRQRGTHFLCLDADEALSAQMEGRWRTVLEGIAPGTSIHLPWLTMWPTPRNYRIDSLGGGGRLWMDAIFADSTELRYESKALSESRTPCRNNGRQLEWEGAGIFHYQCLPWENYLIKQAWYCCWEMINRPNKAREIVYQYHSAFGARNPVLRQIPDSWVSGLKLPNYPYRERDSTRCSQILTWFDEFGCRYFEPLEIWKISEFRDEFIRREGRSPRPFNPGIRLFARRLARSLKQWIRERANWKI